MLAVIYYILFAITSVYSLYFLITGLFAFKKSKVIIRKRKENTKFAVLVPARNEEKVIRDLVESLINQKYDKKLVDIYMLINNCTDSTLDIVKEYDVNVINIEEKVSSKGEVLIYAFEKLKNKKFDAYMVFDADNVVHPDFFKKMNDAYQSGYNVAQGRKDTKNISDNWISCSYSLFYYIQNFFYNRSRTNIDGYATINGTGFMVAKEVIDKGFYPKTITEDIELSIFCMLNDEQIVYVDDAITYDEQPTAFKASWNQRARWSKGIMQCTKLYWKDLLKKDKFDTLDKVLFIIAPYFQILSFILVIMLTIFNICGYELHDMASYVFNNPILSLIIFYVLGILFSGYILKIYNQSIYKNIMGILLFPLFIFTWIPINIQCICKKQVKWVPIEHNKTTNLESLIK